MFKVNTEYDKYEVHFYHNSPPPVLISLWKKGDYSEEDFKDTFGTGCVIHNTVTGAEITQWTQLNPRDQYNRNKGRKLALAKAMKFAFFDCETRKLFWDAYFKARGGKW